jgi:hypothetical protein
MCLAETGDLQPSDGRPMEEIRSHKQAASRSRDVTTIAVLIATSLLAVFLNSEARSDVDEAERESGIRECSPDRLQTHTPPPGS